MRKLEFDKDDASNLIPLPTRAGKDAGLGARRSVHDGGNTGDYFRRIDRNLEKLMKALDADEISLVQARAGVLEVQKTLRNGLRSGDIPLHHFHDKYLAFALIGLSGADLQQLAHELAEIAAAEMNDVLDGHGLNYLRAARYTGKEGICGWIGFGVDLFNPLDDFAMLGDISTLLAYDPTKMTAEEFLAEAAKDAEESRKQAGYVK